MPSAVDTDKRRRDMAAIHIGAKTLGLDDETYRDMLEHIAGPKRGFWRAGAAQGRRRQGAVCGGEGFTLPHTPTR